MTMKKPPHITIPWRWFWWGSGFTLGPIIFLHPDAPRSVYIHELVHVEQFWQDPLLFWVKYLYNHRKHGYRENPYEIEAYERQRQYERGMIRLENER